MAELIAKLEKLEALAVVVFAALLPFATSPPEVAMIVGLCLTVLRMILQFATTKKVTIHFFTAPFAVPLLLMSSAIALSGFLAGGVGEAFNSVWALRTTVVYFWAYQMFATKPHLIFRAIEWLLTTGASAGLYGSIQQLCHVHPFSYPWLQGTGYHSGPMEFAGQMCVLSMLALALFLKKGQKGAFSKWFLAAPFFEMMVLMNVLGVIFASERSAWLGVIAASLIISLIVSWRSTMALIAVFIVAGGIAWFSIPVFQQRLGPLISEPHRDIGVRVRLQIWDRAFKEFQKAPVTGLGFRKFPILDIPEAIVPGSSTHIDHAHSNYLHILATTGLIGMACYLLLHGAILFTAWRRYCANIDDAAIALGIIGAVVSLMVAGFFEYNFKTGPVRLTLWFVLAALLRSQPNLFKSKANLHPASGLEAPSGEKPHNSD